MCLSLSISIFLFRSFPLGIRGGDCEDDVTVLRLLLVADNGNKLRKGEDTWRKEDTCIKEKLEDKEGRRETERIEEREGGENTRKRNEERKWE